ncbi:tetratricopeptide repeat protein [Starkeya koreensis]|uniref:Tetratricopeptide repeat protein n=1 Tax=Ancylobacter koreensis TaxID=266121 RepID=A0ABT0DN69_9HYPH|nr:tetratricopeptide repeat protein [Ancylobacter koreensis]MCK0208726.1 tetratricopeptide repeat protein [Ancylobacter koreensis]
MADIFNEIDEDLRRERFNRLWTRYGAHVIALAVLIVVAVAGWRGYEWWKQQQDQAAGARFEEALQLAAAGKPAEAEAAFQAIEKDGTSGYRVLARFRAATELAKTDKAAAVSDYDAIAKDPAISPLMQNVAQVRAALLLVDTAPLSDIESRLKPLDTPAGAFRHSAREIVGLAQYKAGDYKAATDSFTAILNDGETPPGLRRRAELLRTLAASSLPVPAPAPAAAPEAVPAPEAAPAAAPAVQ